MSSILTFPGSSPKRRETTAGAQPNYEEGRKERNTMHSFLYRSYDLIVESDDADLIRDVGLDIHKAEVKLKKIRQRLQGDTGTIGGPNSAAPGGGYEAECGNRCRSFVDPQAVGGLSHSKSNPQNNPPCVDPQARSGKRLQEWRNSPAGRLDADGASEREQIERRIMWLQQEWQLPQCPKVGRTMSKQLLDYYGNARHEPGLASLRRSQRPAAHDAEAPYARHRGDAGEPSGQACPPFGIGAGDHPQAGGQFGATS